MADVEAGARTAGPRVLARRCAEALAMVWAASPLLTAGLAVMTIVGAVLPTSFALLQRDILNGLTRSPMPAGRLLIWAACLAAVVVITAVTPDVTSYINAQLGRVLGLHAQDRLFRAVNSFPGLRRFETPQFMDRLQMARNTGQAGPLAVLTSSFGGLQSVLTVVGLAGALWIINPVLAAIVVAAASPAIVSELGLSRRRADLQWQLSPVARRQMFYGSLQTDLQAAKEVRLFGIGDFLRARMLTELRSINRGQQRLDRRAFATQGSLTLLGALIASGGLMWTVRQAALGQLPVGDVSLFVLACAGVQNALSALITALAGGYQSVLLFGHYLDVVSAAPDLPLAASPRPVPVLRQAIELRDVWFRYGGDQPWVLRGVSMLIPAASSVGLVGLNGAGKSTLVKLLCRLYDPGKGSIHWDGIDIRELDPRELRSRIGAIFQDYMAYELTAAENIGLGDISRLEDPAAVQRAAVQAGIHDTVTRLPRGYETLLSRIFFDSQDKENPDTGVILSGGQWQRLALARGLMRTDRDLLILDEPTSGMDAEAEYAICRRLQESRAGRTSLLISHRLGSLREADLIFVIAGGHITERGTHDELLAGGGEYCRLFTMQAEAYQGPAISSQAAAQAGVAGGARLAV